MPPIRAKVNGAMLKWARETAGLSFAEAAKKILKDETKSEQIESWELEILFPTVRQLFEASNVYKRPLGTFYLSEFPADFTIPKDFRRLPGTIAGTYSPALRLQIRTAIERREAALELFEDLEEKPEEFPLTCRIEDDPDEVAEQIRRVLGVTIQEQKGWKDQNRYLPLKNWRERIGSLGVLVFQITDVDPSEMLGFAIAEEALPIIGINRKLKPNSRIFALLHEFVHLLLHTGGISDFSGDDRQGRSIEDHRIEVFCNRVAGAVLVPKASLAIEASVARRGDRSESWHNDEISELADDYGVSREVIVRRLLILKKTTERFYREKREEYLEQLRRRPQAKKESVRQFSEHRANRALSILGQPYLRLVLNAHNQGHIGLSQVAGLVGERVKWLPEIERRLTSA